MGQYYKLVNQTKQETVSDIGSAKFFEWLYNNQARVLIWLLRQSNEGGGGDIGPLEQYTTLGRWAGDRVTLVGDYDDSELYDQATSYTDISDVLRADFNRALKADGFVKEFGL